ncbi:hypothetical protein E2C01_048724 [Portunus trituberculatus]|uniref:Uncharacterized protein n=1 Tax=Portunus trituberculatus TaxID=210409 RepID=A0A5B7GCD5_PORTR|nr:hypothetical protein [Portunus trituberculatus]
MVFSLRYHLEYLELILTLHHSGCNGHTASQALQLARRGLFTQAHYSPYLLLIFAPRTKEAATLSAPLPVRIPFFPFCCLSSIVLSAPGTVPDPHFSLALPQFSVGSWLPLSGYSR